jgi:thiamine-phosphate pyrophosphorylase
VNLKISKKKFIYLISPNKIYPQFYKDLKKILETGKVEFFQMRLKKYSFKERVLIGKKFTKFVKKIVLNF